MTLPEFDDGYVSPGPIRCYNVRIIPEWIKVMNKQQTSDMIYAFFRECCQQNLYNLPMDRANQIIDSWIEDYLNQVGK